MTTRTRRTLIAAGLAAGLLVALPACSSSDSGEASADSFCDVYSDLNVAGEAGTDALFSADLDRLVASAPNDELRQAAETVRDGITAAEGVDVDNLDVNDPAALAEAEAALDQLLTPEFTAAADQLDDYAETNCGSGSGG